MHAHLPTGHSHAGIRAGFAADCAESVIHIFEKYYPDDNRPRLAIKAARDFANGEIDAAARDAAWEAAGAAAGAAAGDAARIQQRDQLLKLLSEAV